MRCGSLLLLSLVACAPPLSSEVEPSFDDEAAALALRRVDTALCYDVGPPGRLSVRVAFEPSGDARLIALYEAPANQKPTVVLSRDFAPGSVGECLRVLLEQARVPPFHGRVQGDVVDVVPHRTHPAPPVLPAFSIERVRESLVAMDLASCAAASGPRRVVATLAVDPEGGASFVLADAETRRSAVAACAVQHLAGLETPPYDGMPRRVSVELVVGTGGGVLSPRLVDMGTHEPSEAPARERVGPRLCDLGAARADSRDLSCAYAAMVIRRADVSTCRAPARSLVVVTFEPTGAVSDVYVETGKGTPAAACFDEALRHLHIPPFEGQPIRALGLVN
jgi:hypothetical protein